MSDSSQKIRDTSPTRKNNRKDKNSPSNRKPSRPLNLNDSPYPPPPRIMNDLTKFLTKRGHTCAMITGITDRRFEWCQKDICPRKLMEEDRHHRQKDHMNLLKKLENDGHTCICTPDIYPGHISWCEEDVCVNLKK